MAIYLKKFETMSQYNAYTADTTNFIKPNVSLTVDNSTVHYNPSSPVPPTPSHDYVEIGGVKWATMNVGASSITDGGLYFAWAETSGYTAAQVGYDEGQKQFSDSDYKYFEPSDSHFTKYNSSDGLVTLQLGDDAVIAAWGGNWRTPTISEYQALGEAVNSAWTADYQGSGVSGLVLTDKTDSSKVLFFPACGFCGDGSVYNVDGDSFYWSSSLYTDNGDEEAYTMYFSPDDFYWDGGSYSYRYSGLVVRGVLDE